MCSLYSHPFGGGGESEARPIGHAINGIDHNLGYGEFGWPVIDTDTGMGSLFVSESSAWEGPPLPVSCKNFRGGWAGSAGLPRPMMSTAQQGVGGATFGR